MVHYYYISRMNQLKNINDVNYFIFLSPILLAAILYCLHENIPQNSQISKYLYMYFINRITSSKVTWNPNTVTDTILENIFYFMLIIIWIIMIKGLDMIYIAKILPLESLFDPKQDVIYLIAFFSVILIFIITAKKLLNYMICIALCYTIYGLLFLKTLNSIKVGNGIETYYFVDPYIELMVTTIIIWLIVCAFFEVLKIIQRNH